VVGGCGLASQHFSGRSVSWGYRCGSLYRLSQVVRSIRPWRSLGVMSGSSYFVLSDCTGELLVMMFGASLDRLVVSKVVVSTRPAYVGSCDVVCSLLSSSPGGFLIRRARSVVSCIDLYHNRVLLWSYPFFANDNCGVFRSFALLLLAPQLIVVSCFVS
jgi:hypothetical protein